MGIVELMLNEVGLGNRPSGLRIGICEALWRRRVKLRWLILEGRRCARRCSAKAGTLQDSCLSLYLVQHAPCPPSEVANSIATRIPPNRPRRFVRRCIGCFVALWLYRLPCAVIVYLMAFLVHIFRHEHETMIFGLCRVKLRLTCCEAGKWQTLQKPFNVQYSGQVEGLAKLARLAVEAQKMGPWRS